MEEKFNENLRRIRREKNYSQEYLANRLNISQKAYSDIEQGKTVLKPDMIIKLSSIMNIPPDSICQISCKCKSRHEIMNIKILEYLNSQNITIPKDLFK